MKAAKQNNRSDPPIMGPAVSWIHVIWLAATSEDPQEYYDELTAERWSIRCVRRWNDNRLTSFSYRNKNWRDLMPTAAIPTHDEINSDTQFLARDITEDEFLQIWNDAQQQERARGRSPH